MRSQVEDCLLLIAGLTAEGADVASIQTAALRLQRQLVLDIGGCSKREWRRRKGWS